MTRKSTKKNKTLLDLIEEKPGGAESPIMSEKIAAARELFVRIKKMPAEMAAIELNKAFEQIEDYGRRMSLQDAQQLITEGYEQGKKDGYEIGCNLAREHLLWIEEPVEKGFVLGYKVAKKESAAAWELLLKCYLLIGLVQLFYYLNFVQ